MTRYFYDTEFIEDGKTIELISIGIVADDGREYYAVNDAIDSGDLNDRIARHPWLMQNVIPHLSLAPRSDHLPRIVQPNPSQAKAGRFSLDLYNTAVLPLRVIRNQVRDFLIPSSDLLDNELWAYYAAYDHVALCQLWGPMVSLPDGIPMFTHELMQLWRQAGGPTKPESLDEHHALADARWNYELWKVSTYAWATSDATKTSRATDLDPDDRRPEVGRG